MRTSIINRFADTIKQYEKDVAIIEEDLQITFGDLASMAMKVKDDCMQGDNLSREIIAVLMPKTKELVATNLAILSAGAAFMNLDCKLPEERLRAILEQVKPAMVVTNVDLARKYEVVLQKYETKIIGNEYHIGEKVIWKQDTDVLIDTDPFCVINTSGSTGTPKAVILNQRSFWDFMDWSKEVYQFSALERMGCLTSVYFDIYVFELCMLICNAATMVLLDARYATFPVDLLYKLQKEKVNFIFWVPTTMVNIANAKLLDEIPLPDLQRVWFAGEVFPTKPFLYWYDSLKHTQFSNLYGPIEITLDCTYYIVNRRLDENEAIPIGYPCRNTDILILNDDDKRCGKMEKGELCVRGTSLAMGYYNDLERTQKVFVQNPLNQSYPELIYRTGDIVYENEDGEIMFVGRKDSLIKYSGYRIELTEIEHILVNKCEIVKNCCAVFPKTKKEIVLFYEAEQDVSRVDFIRELGKYVPKYMIPKHFIRSEKLPQNPNGKIDRFRLEQQADV